MRSLPVMVFVLFVSACGHRKAVAPNGTPSARGELSADASAALGQPASPGPTQHLTIEPNPVPQGEPVHIGFMRPGLSGCYHQSDVTRTVDAHHIVFSYTTWYDQGTPTKPVACIAMIPLGGFQQTFTLPEAGSWTGEVQVDGEVVQGFSFEVQAISTTQE